MLTLGVLHDYRMRYTNAFPGAYVRFKQLNYSAEGNSVELRLSGDNWNHLKHTTDIHLDEQKANRLGVNNALVELTMATRYNNSGILP